METKQTQKQNNIYKTSILIILSFCMAFSSCKKDNEYPSKDSDNNPLGIKAENLAGIFNVFNFKSVIDKKEDLGIVEISYNKISGLMEFKKILGNSNIRAGEIEWEFNYTSSVNIGVFNIQNPNGFITRLTCNFTIVDKNQIVAESSNGIKTYFIRRFVQSK